MRFSMSPCENPFCSRNARSLVPRSAEARVPLASARGMDVSGSIFVPRCEYTTTSARCFYLNFLAGFLGLGRPTALTVLPLCLQAFEVLRTSLRDLPPAFPSKTDGGGIFLLGQNLEDVLRTPKAIMPDRSWLTKRSRSGTGGGLQERHKDTQSKVFLQTICSFMGFSYYGLV